MQNADLVQDTSPKWLPGSRRVMVQPEAPAVGFAEVSAFPAVSTATQTGRVVQDTPVSGLVESTFVIFHINRPPAALVEVRTFPARSTATHSDAEGQETADMGVPVMPPSTSNLRSIWTLLQVRAPPVGRVEVSTSPSRSTATHSETDGHETAGR